MRHNDFIVKYDPENDKPEELTKRILYSLIIRRLQYKKPAIMFISGDSGEGKSYTALSLQRILLELQGLDLKDCINDINVYTPLQYAEKLQALIDKKGKDWERLKPVNIICMHEAREIIKAKQWHSFLATSVADINATVRSVKRLCIMIVSQFIRDITTDIRYTLNFYFKVWRPMGGNRRARVYLYLMWKDDRDIEHPGLKKRKISGLVVYPSGKRRRYSPEYLELKPPDREIAKIFDEEDYKSKYKIIKHKMQKLLKEMMADADIFDDKTKNMIDYYINNPEEISRIGKRNKRGVWKLNPEVRKMHGLTKIQEEEFNKKLLDKLKGLEK